MLIVITKMVFFRCSVGNYSFNVFFLRSAILRITILSSIIISNEYFLGKNGRGLKKVAAKYYKSPNWTSCGNVWWTSWSRRGSSYDSPDGWIFKNESTQGT